jgi:hypothetical protein
MLMFHEWKQKQLCLPYDYFFGKQKSLTHEDNQKVPYIDEDIKNLKLPV